MVRGFICLNGVFLVVEPDRVDVVPIRFARAGKGRQCKEYLVLEGGARQLEALLPLGVALASDLEAQAGLGGDLQPEGGAREVDGALYNRSRTYFP